MTWDKFKRISFGDIEDRYIRHECFFNSYENLFMAGSSPSSSAISLCSPTKNNQGQPPKIHPFPSPLGPTTTDNSSRKQCSPSPSTFGFGFGFGPLFLSRPAASSSAAFSSSLFPVATGGATSTV